MFAATLADTSAPDSAGSILWPVVGVISLTLVYLFVDLYGTTNQFRWVFTVLAFYVLLGLQSLLGVIAYFILEVSSSKDFNEHVGNVLVAHWFQALLAVLGSVTVVQSLTVKISGKKLVDLGPWIEGFRKQVFTEVGQVAISRRKKEASVLITKLAKQFANDASELEAELSTALFVINNDKAAANKELEKIKKECSAKPARGYAERLVVIDVESARRLANT